MIIQMKISIFVNLQNLTEKAKKSQLNSPAADRNMTLKFSSVFFVSLEEMIKYLNELLLERKDNVEIIYHYYTSSWEIKILSEI